MILKILKPELNGVTLFGPFFSSEIIDGPYNSIDPICIMNLACPIHFTYLKENWCKVLVLVIHLNRSHLHDNQEKRRSILCIDLKAGAWLLAMREYLHLQTPWSSDPKQALCFSLEREKIMKTGFTIIFLFSFLSLSAHHFRQPLIEIIIRPHCTFEQTKNDSFLSCFWAFCEVEH